MTKKITDDDLKEVAKELYQTYRELKESIDSTKKELDFLNDFFIDYKTSYSLSLAYPVSMWQATAEKMGIDTTGKSRLELAKEIFTKAAEEEDQASD